MQQVSLYQVISVVYDNEKGNDMVAAELFSKKAKERMLSQVFKTFF